MSSPDDVQPDDAALVDEAVAPVEEAEAPAAPAHDELRSPVIDALQAKLGDGVVATELLPGRDAWVRVSVDAWADAARVLRNDLGFTYFCYLSAIDWLPSPFGKSEDDSAPTTGGEIQQGVTGGDTRFQLIARVEKPGTGLGITLKTDVDDANPVAPTWSKVYFGADWHERECWEMFGITFAGHTNLVHLYLPGEFEGHPLRKDFPLISRMVKPWPGLVDVEPMPGDDSEDEETAEADA